MQHMKRSSEKNQESCGRRGIDCAKCLAPDRDRQTREAIKRNFLRDLLEIYEVLPYFLKF